MSMINSDEHDAKHGVRSGLERQARGEDERYPLTVLIGGWAVYCYNPWYGSVDIDLVTNSRAQNTFFTCSFFPNASITIPISAFIPYWINFGRKTKSGRNRTAIRFTP